MSTKIDWCDVVWNPTTGCSKGCPYCYARPFATRMKNNPNEKIALAYQRGFEPTCHPDRLEMPLHWKKPRRIFVDSMGDLFDPAIPFDFIQRVMAWPEITHRHTFMVLTKRPTRMQEFFTPWSRGGMPDNLWLGVSITNQAEADKFIPMLLNTPAKHRFISIEPMLGSVLLHPYLQSRTLANYREGSLEVENYFTRPALDWVICGGQTGMNAVAPEHTWITWLLNQCQSHGVPFYFKGWGKHLPGAQIDGRERREIPA